MHASQERSRERILTQADPARVRRSGNTVVLKDGSTFLVATESGDVPFPRPHGLGLFFKDCRFLDGYELSVNGTTPIVLSGLSVRGFETFNHLTNPALPGGNGRAPIRANTIEIRRERLIRGGVVHERLSVRNYGREPASLRIELTWRATFEDIFVVKGFVRHASGTPRRPDVRGGDRVELGYEGIDKVIRTTTIAFSPAPTALGADRAEFGLEVAPGRGAEITITITPSERMAASPGRKAAPASTPSASLTRWPERAEAIWLDRSAAVSSGHPLFDRVFQRSVLDLHLLRSRLDGFDYFAAGVPWFATLFGRDAALVALQTLPYGPAMARQTLPLLARYQADSVDAYRDAEPGKILHELRAGELANVEAIPQSPAYYGTVDATMLFLMLTVEYVRWSGDLDLARELRPHLAAALEWMTGYGDHDRDGYLDYAGRYRNGLVNQGWKDSGNAIVNADGSLVAPPVALCEVQAYAYRAWRQMAWLWRRLDDPDGAEVLEAKAHALRARFDGDFWDEGLGCYLLARQAGGRPAAVVTSNAGQVLWGGLAEAERATRVAERLLAADMFSGWGIRTLSSEAVAYNPMSYHLGSVWPHDNSLVLDGLRRYGQDAAAIRVFDALFDAASNFPGYRLPELFSGHPRAESEHRPITYPVACSPQAWAAASLPYALWSLLGLSPDAPGRRLEIRRPRLPGWLDQVTIKGVRVGTARVDLRFARTQERTIDVDASVQEGELDVRRTDEMRPPESFD
jgi:glycogen debranching enzyme